MASYGELLRAIEDFDIEGYLSDKGFEPLKTKAHEWVGHCPSCGKDKVAVNVDARTFHCWVCESYETVWDDRRGQLRRRPLRGAGGLIRLIEWLDEVEVREAIETLLETSGLGDVTAFERPTEAWVDIVEHGDLPPISPPDGWAPILSPLPYMRRRGITMEDVATFGLFWCPEGKYRNRLVFPVFEGSTLVYFQARATYEKGDCPEGYRFIKALNPPAEFGAAASSDVLMNLDLAARFPRVAVVEGPMDVVRTGPDAVCTFGKQIHARQAKKLYARGVRALDLMWDGPSATEPYGAHPEMVEACPWLASHFDLRLVFLPHGDPGDWDRGSLNRFRAMGLPARELDPWRLPEVQSPQTAAGVLSTTSPTFSP